MVTARRLGPADRAFCFRLTVSVDLRREPALQPVDGIWGWMASMRGFRVVAESTGVLKKLGIGCRTTLHLDRHFGVTLRARDLEQKVGMS